MNSIEVTALYTYPIKSCGGIALEAANITPFGLEYDRDFMLVDDQNNYLSQRQIPEMALVQPRLGQTVMMLSAPDIENIAVSLNPRLDDANAVLATIGGKEVWGQTINTDLDEWFMDALPSYKDNKTYRLLRILHSRPRLITEMYQQPDASNQVGFADGFSILLATEQSLEALNEELERLGEDKVGIHRFRPNIVVAGEGLEAYDEDFWQKVKIGNVEAYVPKPCDRCVMTDNKVYDQKERSLVTTGTSVRVALRNTRKGVNTYDPSNKGIFFAQNLNHIYIPDSKIAVGDQLEVLEHNSERNVVLRNAA